MWLMNSQWKKSVSEAGKPRKLEWDVSLGCPWFATVLCIKRKREIRVSVLILTMRYKWRDAPLIKECFSYWTRCWFRPRVDSFQVLIDFWQPARQQVYWTHFCSFLIFQAIKYVIRYFLVVFGVGLLVCTCVHMCFSNHKIFICACKRKLRLTAIFALYLFHF